MRRLYTFISTVSLPLIVARLWWRGRRLPGYRRRWRERFGYVTLERDQRPLVWVHAVSVGETIAAVPIVRHLLARGDVQVLVTCMTPTGSDRVADTFGDAVLHSYIPYDLPWLLGRFLRRTQPSLALIMETELWPNTIRACRNAGTPVLLLNARLSEKSARGYSLFPSLTQEILQDLSHVAVQNREDAERFVELGLPNERCTVTGSIKFDLNLPDDLIQQAQTLKPAWSLDGQRPIWIAASTHAGEEEQVLEAYTELKQRFPQLLLVLVPRHPDRFDDVAKLCDERKLQWLRRSEQRAPTAADDLLLGDTMGEMLLLYGVADVAFVGGSLVATGGHNLIEPAAWQLPLISGQHLFNFAEVARLMLRNEALTLVRDSRELAQAIDALLQNEEKRRGQGQSAKGVAEANRGALEKVRALIDSYITPAEA